MYIHIHTDDTVSLFGGVHRVAGSLDACYECLSTDVVTIFC